MFLEILQDSQENTCARASILINLQRPATLWKWRLVQVFSCEFCEISKNTFFNIKPTVSASEFRKLCHFYKIFTKKLDFNIRNWASVSLFEKNPLKLIQTCTNSIFDIHNLYGITLLTRFCLGLSHLHEHIFTYCFQDTLNPFFD